MIAVYQGIDGHGRAYGYDYKRRNIIIWDITPAAALRVAAVEPDGGESGHGSLAATMRDARVVAQAENLKAYSYVITAIIRDLRYRNA